MKVILSHVYFYDDILIQVEMIFNTLQVNDENKIKILM